MLKPKNDPKTIKARVCALVTGALVLVGSIPVMAAAFEPVAEHVVLTPLDRPDAKGATAQMNIVYDKRERLPESFPLYVEGKPYTAKRVGGNEYSVRIPFDFDALVAEQEQRKKMAPILGKVPVFEGREITGHRPVAFLEPKVLKQQIRARLPIRVDADVVRAFSGTVYPESSLLVKATAVVDDPQRTYDVCTNAGNPDGAWTFKRLMENIANQPVTGINAADMVEDWVSSLGVDQTINGFPVYGTTRAGKLLDHWPRDVDGRLDLSHSPFRLLAIVNRIDLRTATAYGNGGAGEGRFIFGIIKVDPNDPMDTCSTEAGTVIFEYGVPLQQCSAIRNYGIQWAELEEHSLGSPSYNAALQAITDQFTSANAVPAKPNGSALNQLRSNDFPITSLWELREFHINAVTHGFDTVSTALTPHFDTYTNTGPLSSSLAQFINQNANDILLERHAIPASFNGVPFLTGSAMNPFQSQQPKTWIVPGTASEPRHKFALNTCNGCHGRETGTRFLHVETRNSGVESSLSAFMTGSGPFVDPVSGTARDFDELARRQYDLTQLIEQGCFSGNVLTDVLIPSTLQVH